MSFFFRNFLRPWIIVPAVALGFVIWVNGVRVQRVEHVTGIAEWSVAEAVIDAASPTGYAGGRRQLIVPDHNNGGAQWIVQAQQMLANGEWRLRRVDYDNAPYGRETHAPALYRWWLGLVAWGDHLLSGRSVALGVEHAALYADPLLQCLLLIGVTLFAARHFGTFSATLLAAGCAFLFPFSASFLPGAPDHFSLALLFSVGSVLPLLVGSAGKNSDQAHRWHFVAGLMGGCGLWISLSAQAPLLVGIALGAIFSAWLTRGQAAATPVSWRAWAAGGALMSLVAYMVEYFPAHMTLQLEVNHPLYAIAWLGGGELLARVTARMQNRTSAWKFSDWLVGLLPLVAVASVPLAMTLMESRGFLAASPLASKLTGLNEVSAKNGVAWVARDGITGPLVAAGLPLLLIAVAAVILWLRRPADASRRAWIALALGPVLVALGFACFQLRWFSLLDSALLGLLVALTATRDGSAIDGRGRWLWAGAVTVILLFSAVPLMPPRSAAARQALSQADVEGVIERDLAHWLAQRVGPAGAVVLASPNLTTALNFHGSLRGLGTLDWENRDGLSAAVRIVSATTPAEAQALINQRAVTHLIIPSWDDFLDEYARMGSSRQENTFVFALNRWVSFGWLRPLPYHLPKIGGFEGQSVVVFEVLEEREEATTISQQAEYFVEMGQIQMAANMRSSLRRFPANLEALVALAQVEAASGNAAGFAAVLEPLLTYIAGGADRSLAWEHRVSLAYVLAQGKHTEQAREQARRCYATINEARVRALTTGSLFRLLVLGKKFGLEIADARVRTLTLELLPPASRSRL